MTNVNEAGATVPVDIDGAVGGSVAENAVVGTVVGITASSTDADLGDTITYSLFDDAGGLFTINPTTGVVTMAAAINSELLGASVDITVRASSSDGSYSDQVFTIAIGDLDEVAPTITSGGVAAAIDENSGAGQVVYTAAADDTADISGGVVFSLGGTDGAKFTIDAGTGAVTLTGDPDHETQSSYSFDVIATDLAGNASTQTVTLAINDLDEVAPTITSAGVAAAIDENIAAGQVVYTASATDTGDISGGVVFSLGGTDAAKFTIDAGTGVVTLTGDPDHETQSSYSFDVIATDLAGNASTPQTVTLAINDLDEVAPMITSGGVAAAIDENSGAGQVVYTVAADDTGDISGGVTFSLKAGRRRCRSRSIRHRRGDPDRGSERGRRSRATRSR